jgi:hypothetical protein
MISPGTTLARARLNAIGLAGPDTNHLQGGNRTSSTHKAHILALGGVDVGRCSLLKVTHDRFALVVATNQ